MKKISLLFVLSILSIQLSTAQNQPTETDPKKEDAYQQQSCREPMDFWTWS